MSKELREKIDNAVNEALETGEASFTINRPEGADFNSIHGVMREIKKLVSLTPEQEFRIHAIIKRHDHYSKEDVYDRCLHYLDMSDDSYKNFLELKVKTHTDMKSLPDEEICTYNVGSHIYKPKPRQSTDSGLQ